MSFKRYSDQKLWKLFQGGNSAALGELYHRHQGRILSASYVALRRGYGERVTVQDIKDALQLTFELILRSDAATDVYDFPKWAVQYVINVWRNGLKKENNRERIRRENLTPTHSFYEIELMLQKILDRSAYLQALRKIENNTYQQVAYLAIFERKSNEEIGHFFNKTTKWAADKKYRALKEYSAILKINGLLE